jgi:hypothetical protein
MAIFGVVLVWSSMTTMGLVMDYLLIMKQLNMLITKAINLKEYLRTIYLLVK